MGGESRDVDFLERRDLVPMGVQLWSDSESVSDREKSAASFEMERVWEMLRG